MATPVLVDLAAVGVRRPDRALFEGLDLTVHEGDRLGVVGRNGSGKSTLLRVLAGVVEPEEGTVRRGRGVRVGFLDQRPELPAGTVRDGVGRHWEAAAILDRLGMGPLADAQVATLSGGQAKRVALARVLLHEVDLLVLDEPTNHLDLDAVVWLEERLARFRGGLVLVTHDRHVLDRLTTRMVELDRSGAYAHDGGYQGYLEARAARAEQADAAESVRRNLARSELAWLRRGAPARTRKPKARIATATAIVETRQAAPDRPGALALDAATHETTPRLGDKVVLLHGAGHRFGDGPWLFRGLALDLAPDGRLGIVGPNGSGKSTLLSLLGGRLAPRQGTVEVGPTVRIGWFDQHDRHLDPALRVRDAVAGPRAEPTWQQARLMERFWFDADAQWATIDTLSGGERRRLQLLLVLAEAPNVLLLDEPTNDLDLDTLRALEDHLDDWPGSLVVVSHDRAHLERTVTDVLALDGRGGAGHVPGGLAGYFAGRAATSGGGVPAMSGAAPADPAPTRAAPKTRTPSTLRRLLAIAERELAEATDARERAVDALSGADHTAMAALADDLAAAEARMAEVEQRWLALAEELGG